MNFEIKMGGEIEIGERCGSLGNWKNKNDDGYDSYMNGGVRFSSSLFIVFFFFVFFFSSGFRVICERA